MMPKVFSLKFICFLFVLSITTSCKKFVNGKPATNLIQTNDLFASNAGALSAVSGVYVQMRALSPSLANGGLSIYAGLASDELATTSSSLEYDAFYTNSILPTSTVVEAYLWSSTYRVIYQTNLIIENLEKSTQISQATQMQLLGEMKVVRALYYFNMVNLFGDVPLITSSDYTENQHVTRTATDSVYKQIINDLQGAEKILPETYAGDYRARPNKWTAAALLAKVYLYKNDWANAIIECSNVINSNAYELEDDLTAVFKNTSNETIWQIAPANDDRNTAEGSVFIPFSPTVAPAIFITQSLLNSFEMSDRRRSSWIATNTVTGVTYAYPFKYKERLTSPVDEYDIVMRLAEIFLIRAEALTHQNKLTAAADDLNVIRKRAGIQNYNAADSASLLSAIMKERKTELFAEWGNRWFDLKRTEESSAVLLPVKPGWQPSDTLFPIPLSEIQINTNLVQNPGY